MKTFGLFCYWASAAAAMAQGVSSIPIGFNSYAFPATAKQNVCIPLYAQPVYIGTISGTTANPTNQFDLVGARFSSGSLASASSPYLAVVAAGPSAPPFSQQGRAMLITGNQLLSTSPPVTRITVDISDGSVGKNIPLNFSSTSNSGTSFYTVGPGCTVQIVPAFTLNTFFGSTSSTLQLVQGAPNAGKADLVSIYNVNNGQNTQYYFDTTSSVQAWNQVGRGNKDFGNTVLYPGTMLQIQRRNASVTAGGIVGIVPQTPPLLKIKKANIYSGFSFPVPFLLNSLANGTISLVGLSPGSTPLNASTAQVFSSTTSNANNAPIYYINGTSWYVANGFSGSQLTQNVTVNPTQGVIFSLISTPSFPYLYCLNLPYPIVPFNQPVSQ